MSIIQRFNLFGEGGKGVAFTASVGTFEKAVAES